MKKIRRATVDDAYDIAKIRINGWKVAYDEIINDTFLNSLSVEKEAINKQDCIKNGDCYICYSTFNF